MERSICGTIYNVHHPQHGHCDSDGWSIHSTNDRFPGVDDRRCKVIQQCPSSLRLVFDRTFSCDFSCKFSQIVSGAEIFTISRHQNDIHILIRVTLLERVCKFQILTLTECIEFLGTIQYDQSNFLADRQNQSFEGRGCHVSQTVIK